MPDFCTCGAQLPPEARFCHKCGKPQRDEPHLREAEPAPAPPPAAPAPPPEPPPIGFQNRTAVWIALRVGVLAFLLSMFSGIFSVVWLVAGGFFAVYLYRKRTGERLSVISGAHLGWLSGIFGFVITTMLFTMAVLALSEPETATKVQEQWKLLSISEVDAKRIIDLVRSPAGVVAVLSLSFLLFSVLPAFGGAMGAKLLRRD